MPGKVRIGVIGAGWWATDYHIPGLQAEPDAELVAVCDPHEGRLAEAARAYHLTRTYTDYREMLDRERLDGAAIVTPHATHFSIASDCLDRGLHLLIEKPMTLTAQDARDLIQRAAAQQREIMIGYTQHYFTPTLQARAAIRGGKIGEIQYVNSSFSSDVFGFLSGKVSPENSPARYSVHGPSENYNRPELLGGGQGHLQLTHSTGLLFFVTGLRARRVQALMNNHGQATDLVDAFSVAFEGGALGVVGGTGNAGGNPRMALTVYGSEGCYLSDSLAHFDTLRNKAGLSLPLDTNGPAPYRYSVSRNFVEVIQGKAANLAPGEIGWRAVELLDAAYRSARLNGQPVDVEDLYQ
ncbi:MAG: gfo/Idh/MocA family oxidoreductase [Chloroflexi bacterium]|nr:MAG: gfo/Idh/MocA family oxidoreductase [Chloroflexota bacterium]